MPGPPLPRLYFVRHGRSTHNESDEDRPLIWDAPLHALGVRQASMLRQRLAQVPFDLCFTSPLTRAVQTALIALGRWELALPPPPQSASPPGTPPAQGLAPTVVETSRGSAAVEAAAITVQLLVGSDVRGRCGRGATVRVDAHNVEVLDPLEHGDDEGHDAAAAAAATGGASMGAAGVRGGDSDRRGARAPHLGEHVRLLRRAPLPNDDQWAEAGSCGTVIGCILQVRSLHGGVPFEVSSLEARRFWPPSCRAAASTSAAAAATAPAAAAAAVSAPSPVLLASAPAPAPPQKAGPASAPSQTARRGELRPRCPVIAVPDATEQLNESDDLGSPAEELRRLFPEVDFGLLPAGGAAWWYADPSLPESACAFLSRRRWELDDYAEPDPVFQARVARLVAQLRRAVSAAGTRAAVTGVAAAPADAPAAEVAESEKRGDGGGGGSDGDCLHVALFAHCWVLEEIWRSCLGRKRRFDNCELAVVEVLPSGQFQEVAPPVCSDGAGEGGKRADKKRRPRPSSGSSSSGSSSSSP